MTDCPDDNLLNAWLECLLDEVALVRVTAHVEACVRCRALVAEFDSERTALTNQHQQTSLRTLVKVGRFDVLRPLGEGGMGQTFLALDTQLQREVCLKVLKPLAGDDPSAERERLLSEARAQARLSHPSIVPVYEVVADDDVVALVMEFVREGVSLRLWLRAASRSAEEVLAVLCQAAEGLVAAHSAGIVHRDFKPDNVMLADGRARIIDFGLARHLLDLGVSAPIMTGKLTRTIAAGTPAYMAPEQFAGEPGDARADQYSFCVTLYEALSGARPFRRARLQEQLRAQLDEPVSRHERIAAPVHAALSRGLDPDPARRFPSMEALLAALRRPASRSAGSSRVAMLVVAAIVGVCVPGAVLYVAGQMRVTEPTIADAGGKVAVAPVVTPVLMPAVSPAVSRVSPAALPSQPRAELPGEMVDAGLKVTEHHRSVAQLDLEVTPAVDVLWKGRVIGRAPGRVSLPQGLQTLELMNRSLGARRQVKVAVPGTLPAVLGQGELELRISPWAYVTVDGHPLGASPVPVQSLWEGPHQVVLERPELGYRSELTVVVTPGARALLRHVVPEKP